MPEFFQRIGQVTEIIEYRICAQRAMRYFAVSVGQNDARNSGGLPASGISDGIADQCQIGPGIADCAPEMGGIGLFRLGPLGSDDALEIMRKAESLDQGIRQPTRLVGTD